LTHHHQLDEPQIGKRIVRSELLTLKSLADVRDFVGRVPADRSGAPTWQVVGQHLKAAAARRRQHRAMRRVTTQVLMFERVGVR
jgi:hypothetical protein